MPKDTTIDPFAVDLESGQDMPPMELLAKGFHKFILTSYELVDKPAEEPSVENPEGSTHKRYVQLELEHAETGAPRRAFVNWPIGKPPDANGKGATGDYANFLYSKKTDKPILDANKNHMTAAGSKISVIRTVISALGGPEMGKVSPDSFAQVVGNSALFLVSVREWPEGSGEYRDQVDLQFGKGVKPC